MSTHTTNRHISGLKGVIVAGGDNHPDPKKLGRVKVFFPQIHGSDFDIEKAPWVQTQSSPNQSGPISFDRPPQEGSLIHGTNITDSGHCYVSHVISGKYLPQDQSANFDLTKTLAWFARARDIVPKEMSGPLNFSQTTERNRNGTEKVTAGPIQNSNAPSMTQRDGTPSNGSSPNLVRKYPQTTNIGTALQKAMESMSQDLAKSIPGVNFNLSNLLSSMPPNLMNQINKTVPKEVMGALQNSLNLIGSYTPTSGTNFLNISNNVDPSTFFPKAANTLVTLRNVDEIDQVLETIINTVETNSPNTIISFEIEGPFGNVKSFLYPNGNLLIEQSNTVTQAISSFEGLVGGITGADSINFLNNSDGPSEIVKKLIYRLPVSEQKSLKEAIERKGKDIQKKLNDAAKTFFGGGQTS